MQDFLPDPVQVLEHRREVVLEQGMKYQVSSLSAAAIDLLLRPYRHCGLKRPFSTIGPGTFIRAAIPVGGLIRGKYGQYIPVGNVLHLLVAYGGEGIGGQGTYPLSCVFGTAPRGAAQFNHMSGSFSKRGALGAPGFLDGLQSTPAGSDWRAGLSMALPLIALWALAAPFLHAFMRKLSSSR